MNSESKHTTLRLPWSIVDGHDYAGRPEPRLVDARGRELFLFAWFTPSDRPLLEAICQIVNASDDEVDA